MGNVSLSATLALQELTSTGKHVYRLPRVHKDVSGINPLRNAYVLLTLFGTEINVSVVEVGKSSTDQADVSVLWGFSGMVQNAIWLIIVAALIWRTVIGSVENASVYLDSYLKASNVSAKDYRLKAIVTDAT